MNRKQLILLFLIVAALVVTWLFPYYTYRSASRGTGNMLGGVVNKISVEPRYSFLFIEPGTELKIAWGRLVLTDLIIVAVSAPILYALRSKS